LTFPTEERAFEHLSQAHEARRVWDSIEVLPNDAPPAKKDNPPTQRAVPKPPKVTLHTTAQPKVVKRPREEMVAIIAGPNDVNMEIRTVNGQWLCPACHEPRASANAISRHLSSNCRKLKTTYEQPKESLLNREAPNPPRVVSARQQCRVLGIQMEDNFSDDEEIPRLSEKVADAPRPPISPEPQFDGWTIVPEDPKEDSEPGKSPGFPTKFVLKRQRIYSTDKRRKLTEKPNDENGEMDECSPPIATRC
jgi:hypothetical protein